MKKIYLILLIIPVLFSCENLDLNPLSEGSSENWYSNETEIQMSLNDLYRTYLWTLEDDFVTERMTDNWSQRQAVNAFSAGSINSEWNTSSELWLNTYKGITRANSIINSLKKLKGTISDIKIEQFSAEAHFFRAIYYSRLVFYYGDVPFYTTQLDIDEAFNLVRTDKKIVMKQVYEDFDLAIAKLPISYDSNNQLRATKGGAMAFKARAAIYLHDYEIARDASKACMDLKVYELHSNYGDYFLSKTRRSKETIFALPRSFELGSSWNSKNFYTRTAGGSDVAQPSWELLAAYLCTDGLPIDKSPLFDPRNPFKNRDPRLHETIAEFGKEHLGFIYDPNPYSTKVLNVQTGLMTANKDTRSVDTYASYNGLTLKKGVDVDWTDNNETDFDIRIMRYADVLLMYAESKIELGEIDDSTLNAINQVRARAYGVSTSELVKYPSVKTINQDELRTELRTERRVEFAWENRRFDDIIRWKIADKVLTKPIYGMLDVKDLKAKVIDKQLWFFPQVPEIDSDGLPDFEPMYKSGLIKLLVERKFDTRQYLFPIPSKEISINSNIKQNPGY